MIVIPATISNNVPGTEFSLGCDTALNEITEVKSPALLVYFVVISKPFARNSAFSLLTRYVIAFDSQPREQRGECLSLKPCEAIVDTLLH